ncbi:MAG: Ig-like domain-containing protein [Bacillota bacterium]
MQRTLHALTTLAMLASLALLPGCGGGSSGGTVPTGNANFTIAVTPTASTVTVGGIRRFTAVARDANGNVVVGISFAWHSSDITIAVSKGGGSFEGVAAGTVNVTATATSTSNSGHTFTTVTSNVATLSVTPDAVGTAAEGAAIVGGVVSLRDANGQFAAGGSDAAGRFDIPVAGMTAPFLLKVEDAQGHTLYGVAMGPGIVNIDPYTDLLVRAWYGLRGADPAGAFAGRAPLPDAADLKALDRFIVEMLANVLEEQGLDAKHFSLLTTPFDANHRGFDRLLDLSQVDPARGSVAVSTSQGLETGRLVLDPQNAALHWTLTSPLPGARVSASDSLILPGAR